ncbi:uncharacterized protein DSM5745_03266 [Aspergillus mulundensis]|uniref:Uncharacterized protein n=1 Tax=Aspergillus mulundensis TaxID=1810919 RepID=A0A3D8SK94_9EURO|nr:Uncharacterized protein DSM5745_03266 [Aspergillus mulundensis]RDW86624.1 Uncharacterized protein DSM5745_03266 [Aspergillus mulundensis]
MASYHHQDGRYGSLPQTLTVHGQWTKLKSMNLCGATPKDKLCLIEMQTGYSGRPPLGMRTGFILRDGMSSKDPVLAAAGDEVPGLHAFNPNGIVFLPRLEFDADTKPHGESLDTEVMRAEPGLNDDVAFHFSIEVGEVGEEGRREEFAWRRVKEGKKKGFKLVRVDKDDEPQVAFLEWVMAWPKLTHAFTLQLAEGQAEELGGRWVLMVAVTAIRLYTLYVKGKTNKLVVDMGRGGSEK